MRNETLGMKEIDRKYEDEGVLIEPEELDDNLNVNQGKIISHCSCKEETCARLSETKAKDLVIKYSARFPMNLVVVFQ